MTITKKTNHRCQNCGKDYKSVFSINTSYPHETEKIILCPKCLNELWANIFDNVIKPMEETT